jgi:hypothetical protein
MVLFCSVFCLYIRGQKTLLITPSNPFDKLTAPWANGPELAEGHPERRPSTHFILL